MPTMLSESAGGPGANSASARSVGKSSACRLEHQALSCESPSVLHPCRDQDRPYQLRLGIVMQAYRKDTLTCPSATTRFPRCNEELTDSKWLPALHHLTSCPSRG